MFFRGGILLILIFFTTTGFVSNGISDTEPNGDITLVSVVEKQAIFSNYVHGIYENLGTEELSFEAFDYAMRGYWKLRSQGKLEKLNIITVIDFTQSANQKRMYVIDLDLHKVILQTYVAHGMKTGNEFADDFSNEPNSSQSSLGFFITGEPYKGRRGHSLKLDGQESRFNSEVRKRGVVIHAAEYATEEFIKQNGRLGRSQGCPAVAPEVNAEIIELLKGKSCYFIYAKDGSYKRHSRLIRGESHLDALYAQQMLNC